MKWSEMTSKQRDMLVAVEVMGYTPIMCDVEGIDDQWVSLYSTGDAHCRKCHGRGHIGYRDGHPEKFKHQIIPPEPYSTDMNAVMQIIELDRFTNVQFERMWRNEHWPSELHCHCRIVTHGDLYYCAAATAQEAVCLAALYACGVKVEEEP